MNPSEVKKIGLWLLILFVALSSVYYAFKTAPPIPKEHQAAIKIPKSIEDVQSLAAVLSQYKQNYLFQVGLIYSLVFIVLQSFSIPGTIFLSFLGGALFGFIPGLLVVCFLSACGASGSYFLSYLVGRKVIQKCAPHRLKAFSEQVEQNRSNLWFYFLFIRITPLIPNWFVNLASPILSIPFRIFFVGTFFGVMPQSSFAVYAGLTIQEVKSVSDVLDWRVMVGLLMCGFVALIPTTKTFQKYMSQLLEKQPSKKLA